VSEKVNLDSEGIMDRLHLEQVHCCPPFIGVLVSSRLDERLRCVATACQGIPWKRRDEGWKMYKLPLQTGHFGLIHVLFL
jgi:hypothetical protein